MSNYTDAVAWVQSESECFIKHGKFVANTYYPTELILTFELGLRPIVIDGKRKGVFCSKEAAAVLYKEAQRDRGAFELCRKMVSRFLYAEKPLPPGFVLFLEKMIFEEFTIPKKGKKVDTWVKAFWLNYFANKAREMFELEYLSRSSHKATENACDAVREGLDRNGCSMSWSSINDYVVGTKPHIKQWREEFEELRLAVNRSTKDGSSALLAYSNLLV